MYRSACYEDSLWDALVSRVGHLQLEDTNSTATAAVYLHRFMVELLMEVRHKDILINEGTESQLNPKA